MPVLAHSVYTNAPAEGPFVIFPTHAHQILSNCIHICGVSILSFCFARRTESENFGTRQWWSSLTWARLLVVLLFLDSWIFLAFSGILVNGVGLSLSVPVCSLGIYACIIFYAGSKALIYLFLVERVWIVWSAGNQLTRFQSRIYKVCALVVLGFLVIFVDMIVGRIAQIRSDGVCIIGLRSFATIPLLSYDLFVNVFLTAMFLWALYREENVSQRLRRLARRSTLAAVVALTTSFVNIVVLATLDGKQLGWVCLGSCAADVTVNALVLFWVTAGGHRETNHKHTLTLPTLHVPVSFVRDPNLRTETDPMQFGHVSPKDLDDATAAKSMSLRGSNIQFCSSPYPHRHHFSCDYDAHIHHYSQASSPVSPTSAKGCVYFSNSDHTKDVERGTQFVEEEEWDIMESSVGHNTMKDDLDAEVWRMPVLASNPLTHLQPSPNSADLEPDSPAYSVATDALHGSYTRLVASRSFSNRKQLSQHSSMTRVNAPPVSVPAPAFTRDSPPTPPIAPPSSNSALAHHPVVQTEEQAPPPLPRKPSRRKLQRPQRPRSVSSPPSTAISRDTTFSGETGESATLVCHSTCAAGYLYASDPYYPSEEEYERWKKGEGSSTGMRRFMRQSNMPRRTNTLPILHSNRHPPYPSHLQGPGTGHRHSGSSHRTSLSSNANPRSRSGIWRSFGAALGLGRTRSWALGSEDFQVGGFEGHGRDGFNAALARSGPGLGLGEGGSSIEVTVTTRTTVDVVGVRRMEERAQEERERERGEERRMLRRARSDLGGGSPTSDVMPDMLEELASASLPASMRLSSSSPSRRPLVHQYFSARDGDSDSEALGEESEHASRNHPLPEHFPHHRFGPYDGVHDDAEDQTHSKPYCAAGAETANDSIPTHNHPTPSAIVQHSLSSTTPQTTLLLTRPPRSLQPERPVLPHLIIDPHTRTSTSHSTSINTTATATTATSNIRSTPSAANVTFRPSS